MPKATEFEPTFPGEARVVLQVYDDTVPRYRDVRLSVSAVRVGNKAEMRDLWQRILMVIDGGEWRRPGLRVGSVRRRAAVVRG